MRGVASRYFENHFRACRQTSRSYTMAATPLSFTTRYSKCHVQLPARMFVAGFLTVCSGSGPEATRERGINSGMRYPSDPLRKSHWWPMDPIDSRYLEYQPIRYDGCCRRILYGYAK